jgi:uncharacterized protein (DUF2236 family)
MELIGLRRGVKNKIKLILDESARDFLSLGDGPQIDFLSPPGEPALVPPDSVSWRVFKNPVSLFIGGVAAVILELAEARVRAGVWEHTNFRADPQTRLRRTGLAAMVTVYGARSVAEAMIENVNRLHARVSGVTPCGAPYSATDPDLLTWVQATAGFGFLEAYGAYVAPLTDKVRDRYYHEGRSGAALYGADAAPNSLVAQRALFAKMRPQLEPSPIIDEFLEIMRDAPAFPRPMRRLQHLFVRAAVAIVPDDIRDRLDISPRYRLRPFENDLICRLARRAETILLPSSPAVQACRRLGLPSDYLYQRA